MGVPILEPNVLVNKDYFLAGLAGHQLRVPDELSKGKVSTRNSSEFNFHYCHKVIRRFLLILLGKVAVLVRTSVPQLLIWNTGSAVRSLLEGTVRVSELHTSILSGFANNLPVPIILRGGDGLC